MSQSLRVALCSGVCIAWAAGTGFGLAKLWSYGSTSGLPARAPLTLPAQTSVTRSANLPVLVLLLHPRCPCSRATVDELARLMAECQGKLTTTVLVLRPADAPEGWERTDLWRSAAAIPGVTVLADNDGMQSREFGAATSGQAVLYAADGRLLFAGGITESRGHSGDNAGRSAIVSLVRAASPASAGENTLQAPVYGCPLFDRAANCRKEGMETCPN